MVLPLCRSRRKSVLAISLLSIVERVGKSVIGLSCWEKVPEDGLNAIVFFTISCTESDLFGIIENSHFIYLFIFIDYLIFIFFLIGV